MKKCLLFSEEFTTFESEYISEILTPRSDIAVTALSVPPQSESFRVNETALKSKGCTIFHYYDEKLQAANGMFSRVRRGLSRLFRHSRVRQYDLIQLLWVSPFSAQTALCARKDARVVASFLGSDLLRSTPASRALMEPVLRRADAITMETEHERDVFARLFHGKYLDKVILTVFGTNIAKQISDFAKGNTKEASKAIFDLPSDKICVFAGTTGSKGQRHLDILRALETMPEKTRGKIFVVFHCAYGLDEAYRDELAAAIAKSSIESRLMTEFLTGERLYALRMCMDVMINVQPTDAFSGTMMECMETDTVIVKGEWLHYPEVERHGAYLVDTPSVEELTRVIGDIVEHYDAYRERAHQNRGLSRLKSWDYSRNSWLKALGLDDTVQGE